MGEPLTARQVLEQLGLPTVGPVTPLSGGNIGSVVRVGELVVKTYTSAPDGLVDSEWRGLERLANAGIRVPTRVARHDHGLVLTYIEPGRRDPEKLGRMLAHLHGTEAEIGSDGPLYLGRFPLPEGRGSTWGEHWWRYRIQPLLHACHLLPRALSSDVERVTRAADWGDGGSCLLHGDLWSGNVLDGASGPVLIDPSCQGGHRAVDLGMMALFGGFEPEVMRAYEREHPVDSRTARLIPVAQLYFALLHVHEFGQGYVATVDRIVREARSQS